MIESPLREAMRGLICIFLAFLALIAMAGCDQGDSRLTLVPTKSAEGVCMLVTVTCAVVIGTCIVLLFRGRK